MCGHCCGVAIIAKQLSSVHIIHLVFVITWGNESSYAFIYDC